MIVKKNEHKFETRKIRDGKKEVTLEHYLNKEDLNDKFRMVAMMIIEPGASVGKHIHDPEGEIYIVVKGKVLVTDNDKEVILQEGDSMWTANGDSHSVENISNENAEVLGIVVN